MDTLSSNCRHHSEALTIIIDLIKLVLLVSLTFVYLFSCFLLLFLYLHYLNNAKKKNPAKQVNHNALLTQPALQRGFEKGYQYTFGITTRTSE